MRTVIGAVQDAGFLGRRRRAQNTEQPEIVGSHTALEAAMAPQWGCAAQQIFPASGATGTSSSVATVYFVAYFLTGAGVSGSLHVAVGAHGTLEGGPLVAASPPPGTVVPTAIPLPDATDIGRERYRDHARGRSDIPNSTVQRHMPSTRRRGDVLYLARQATYIRALTHRRLSRHLSDFDKVTVRIANVASRLTRMHLRLGQEDGASRTPELV